METDPPGSADHPEQNSLLSALPLAPCPRGLRVVVSPGKVLPAVPNHRCSVASLQPEQEGDLGYSRS